MKLLDGLNPAQRDAVTRTEGPVLVLAGAGSGKTRVITRRIAYLIAKGFAPPDAILALTFTNKAAAEMRERVGELIGASGAKQVWLSTFHAFCLRILRAECEHVGYRKNFTVSSEGDSRTLVRRMLDDLEGVKERFSPELVLSRIASVKNGKVALNGSNGDGTGGETDQKYERWLPAFFEQYQSALRAANTVDFDDLLSLTLQLWREHPRVLHRYQVQFRYILVDEYQDTNRTQYALLKALSAAHRNLCVVGDDDQAIYTWRGAGIENILDFESDFPEAHVVKLEQNYRSVKTVLAAANAVIGHNVQRRAKKLWSDLDAGRRIDCIVTGDDEHEAKTAVDWFHHIQARARASYADFALLYRSNIQSRPFEVAFRQAGIPYEVFGGQALFERAEVRDVVAYLRVLANPRDEPALLRIINVPRRGIGDATMHDVHELCRTEGMTLAKGMRESLVREVLTPHAADGLREFLGILSDYRARLKQGGVGLSQIVLDLLERIDYRGEIARTSKSADQSAVRWANVDAVVGAVYDYERETPNPTLSGFLDRSSLDGRELAEGRKSRDRRSDAVSLMTIHSAKGLEFPFVFVVGMEDGLLPHDKSMRDGGLEEERRLFYVALTRARRHISLFYSLSRVKHGKARTTSPSRFLQEIPETLINRHVKAAPEMMTR